MPQKEYAAFVDRCNDFTNLRKASILALNSKTPSVRCNEVIRLHARNVLRTMHASASIFQLVVMAERIEAGFLRRQRRSWRGAAVIAIKKNLLLVIGAAVAVVAVSFYLGTIHVPLSPWLEAACRAAIAFTSIVVGVAVVDRVRSTAAWLPISVTRRRPTLV
jgi:hypothetical protein